MNENVCNFIPYRNDCHSIHTINFVYETQKQVFDGLISQAVYKIHYVCNGRGILHLTGKTVEISKGDIFFTFPGLPFCIESVEDFSYMYISFLGARSNMIMDMLKISPDNFCFEDCKDIYPLWQEGLDIINELSDLIIESILLRTFYFIGNKFMFSQESQNNVSNFALSIKQFVDDNYSDCSLSLHTISQKLSYSPKYISSTFKKHFRIGLIDYITTMRIQHAYNLINQGFTGISDISNQCGYSDPQYFSKIFKKRTGQTPSEYIQTQNNPVN